MAEAAPKTDTPKAQAQTQQPQAKSHTKGQAGMQPKSAAPLVSKVGAAGGLAALRPNGTAPMPDANQPKASSKQTAAAPAAIPAGACRVWTASYGGVRGLIIRSMSDGHVNYTVLDVNEGAERREADAYIQAYARGGTILQEFATGALALERAFDLCPEG